MFFTFGCRTGPLKELWKVPEPRLHHQSVGGNWSQAGPGLRDFFENLLSDSRRQPGPSITALRGPARAPLQPSLSLAASLLPDLPLSGSFLPRGSLQIVVPAGNTLSVTSTWPLAIRVKTSLICRIVCCHLTSYFLKSTGRRVTGFSFASPRSLPPFSSSAFSVSALFPLECQVCVYLFSLQDP